MIAQMTMASSAARPVGMVYRAGHRDRGGLRGLLCPSDRVPDGL